MDNPKHNEYDYEYGFVLNKEYSEEWIDKFRGILGDRFVAYNLHQIYNAESLYMEIEKNSDKFILITGINNELYNNKRFISVLKQALNRYDRIVNGFNGERVKFNGFIALCVDNDTHEDLRYGRNDILARCQDRFDVSPSFN